MWAAALDSGDYEQGTGVLHNREMNTFCCLGVLCNLAVKNGVEITVRKSSYSQWTYYNENYSTLPVAVMEWAGMEDSDPSVRDGENGEERAPEGLCSGCLVTWNDSIKLTFPKIASLIRENHADIW